MERLNESQAALFEHRFWLQVLGDHARFILNALSPVETAEIQRAHHYIQTFDRLLQQARTELAGAELTALNQNAQRQTIELRSFKLHLLRRHLLGDIGFGLTPTFLNHMVNELEEYLRLLQYIMAGQAPPLFDSIHHHLLWLPDASGHANAITAELDMMEKQWMRQTRTFAKHFDEFYLKAIELAGYMRANVKQFPALGRFNKQVEMEIALFRQFLRELEELELSGEILGSLSPLMADHMAREECYYLLKLSQVSEVKFPACDPAKPRTQP